MRVPKPAGGNLDQDNYRKRVEDDALGISLDTVSLSDLDVKLQSFCDVYIDAAEKSVPCIRRGEEALMDRRDERSLSIADKQVFFQWKMAVRPGP